MLAQPSTLFVSGRSGAIVTARWAASRAFRSTLLARVAALARLACVCHWPGASSIARSAAAIAPALMAPQPERDGEQPHPPLAIRFERDGPAGVPLCGVRVLPVDPDQGGQAEGPHVVGPVREMRGDVPCSLVGPPELEVALRMGERVAHRRPRFRCPR